MLTVSKYMRAFFLCLVMGGCLLPTSHYANAAGGLLVSPTRVVFGPNERLKEVRVVNRGNEAQKYRISVINRTMTVNGQMEPASEPGENEFFAEKYMRYGPRQVTLDPKESQTIRIMSRLPANAADGEYRSHILIQEVPKATDAKSASNAADDRVGVNVQAIFGMSIPVFMRKGDLTAEISLSDPKIVEFNGSKFVEVKINRSGNKSVLGTAKVLADDKEIAILKGVAVYLSAPYRTVLLEIPEEYAQSIAGKSLRITYGASQSGENAPPAEITFTAP